ncbi:YbaN family protein [Stakelama saccharophila]|uniref:YbaN family protein n=1 Tax=Stakelama saccharophila TaxID=3075605 RepID=A0ABZ0BDE0_9SPHN|nr:YbaN family protein [Stakelama sp. W311]WNO55217.1 YbaN family protein [Stakelama sp. W311]
MTRTLFFLGGWSALALGLVGVFLPLLPTVPFVILAAFCFARSSPALERRLIEHPRFGPHIAAWREAGAISRRGKWMATAAFAVSVAAALYWMRWPWVAFPLAAMLASGTWIWTRPER